jgi:hypothetical protein
MDDREAAWEEIDTRCAAKLANVPDDSRRRFLRNAMTAIRMVARGLDKQNEMRAEYGESVGTPEELWQTADAFMRFVAFLGVSEVAKHLHLANRAIRRASRPAIRVTAKKRGTR